ncbi:MAG: LysE family translocator [Alphaproteobacteria bacterium]|nr:LysE family translocator [Alphaproteobacteria bacterium]
MTLADWLLFLPAAAFLGATPGPSNLLAASHGLRYGLRPAWIAVGARMAVYAVHIALSLAGLGAVLATSAAAFEAVRWFGVVYLGWVGWQSWTAPPASLRPEAGDAATTAARLVPLLRREALLAVGNVKGMLIFVAAFPPFLDPAAPLLPQALVIGATYLACEWMAAGGWAYAGAALGRLAPTDRALTAINRGFASLFWLLALALIAYRR